MVNRPTPELALYPKVVPSSLCTRLMLLLLSSVNLGPQEVRNNSSSMAGDSSFGVFVPIILNTWFSYFAGLSIVLYPIVA